MTVDIKPLRASADDRTPSVSSLDMRCAILEKRCNELLKIVKQQAEQIRQGCMCMNCIVIGGCR